MTHPQGHGKTGEDIRIGEDLLLFRGLHERTPPIPTTAATDLL
jgi:hypothetical protein